ncbi:MAG: hypothetical protein R3B81_10195 [bacterium]
MTTPIRTPIQNAGRFRWARHLVLSVLLWITYVIYWRIVLSRGVEGEAAFAIGLLGLFVILQVAFTQAWIAHNRRISRRHASRRTERPRGAALPQHDFLGRVLRVEPGAGDLKSVPLVVVRIEDARNEKRFETGLDHRLPDRERRAG